MKILTTNKKKVILILLLCLGVALIYFVFDPATNKYFPSCIFYKLTGLFCPGCGAQRSIHSLLTGNIIAAVHANILLVFCLPFLIVYYAIQTLNFIRPHTNIKINIVNRVWFIYLCALVVVCYWIARNVPVLEAGFLAPH